MKQFSFRGGALSCLALCWCLAAGTWQAPAANPTVVNTLPGDNAFNVSPSASVVFTFSEAMDTDTNSTYVVISVLDPLNPLGGGEWPVTRVWSAGNTVMTCTPISPFPSPTKIINWTVSGATVRKDSFGDPFLVDAQGMFFTGTGGGGTGTGSGTNRYTSFTVGKALYYSQTNNSAPSLDPDIPYAFLGQVSLASNRTATAISLALPTGATTNLGQAFGHPELWHALAWDTNQSSIDAAFPPGNYTFTVNAATSNETVTVNLPSAIQQPPAPQIQNYQQLQSIDASQPLTVSWAPWAGATANDYIFVDVGNYHSPDFIATNAIKGTATSVVVPANSMLSNSNYKVTVGFYRINATTNATEFRGAYRATLTMLDVATASGPPAGSVSLGGIAWNGASFGFSFATTPGQITTIETSPDLLTWTRWITTNATGAAVQITDPRPPGRQLFYRARNGS